MKELISLILFFGTVVLSYALEKQKCCENDEIMEVEGICDMQPVIRLNCTDLQILLKNIIINGDKISTLDQPNITIVDNVTQYCIGRMYQNESQKLGVIPVALVCLERVLDYSRTIGVLSLISVFFLVTTLAVYIYLPELRDPHGLCYTCMCSSMAIAFLTEGAKELSHDLLEKIPSAIVGSFQYFWVMTTLFWINVTCINVYLINRTNKKRFLWYNCYAWGSPLLLLLVSFVVDSVKGDHWKPGVEPEQFFFSGKTESWIFCLGPTSALILTNTIIFILHSYRILKHVTYPPRHLQKFSVIIMFFFLMGIPWIFKVASFIHGQPHILWEVTDIFNSLQGLVMFIILVLLRRTVIKRLVEKLI